MQWKAFFLSVNETTQKVRNLLRKYINFRVVFWKHHANKKQIPWPKVWSDHQMFAYFQIAPTRQCETNWHCCSCSHLATWGKNIAEYGSQITFSFNGFEIKSFDKKYRIREISEITEYGSQIIFWRDNMRAAEFLTPNVAPSDVASSPKVLLTLSTHL